MVLSSGAEELFLVPSRGAVLGPDPTDKLKAYNKNVCSCQIYDEDPLMVHLQHFLFVTDQHFS